MKTFVALFCLVAVVVADGIGGHPGAGFAGPAYHEPEYNSPPSYEFGYGVQGDPHYGGASFGHNEARNGYSTTGEYRVQLPDGRTQIVTYNVGDAYTGYVANVRYEGTAIPYQPAPAPAYGGGPIHG